MRKLASVLVVVVCGLAISILTGVPAQAATGDVTVFSTELQPLDVYHDPVGCVKLPVAAHVLTNQTSSDVRVYADPFCLTPNLTVQPGYGSHVAPGSGSFFA
jgi:hypothetical protein